MTKTARNNASTWPRRASNTINTPAALPTVELSSIKMDLFRRDFTINAMALRLNKGQFGCLVDFFGGQSDIQRKTIRIIHALSFVEDPTRIIRAVRFEQRYGFHISTQGEKLIKNALSLNLVENCPARASCTS